jgi:hypothetical protein
MKRTLLGFGSLLAFSLAACGGSSSGDGAGAGAGGSGAVGGSAGSGTAGGSAGTGTGGSAGSGTGATGGSAGATGGSAGSGGAMGGSAGSGGGAAGASGSAGSGGSGPPAACQMVGGEVLVGSASSVTLAWDTDHYVLAYVDPTAGMGDVTTVRLDADGKALGTPTVVEASAGPDRLPVIAKTTTGWMAVYDVQSGGLSNVHARPLDAMAAPTGSPLEVAKLASMDARSSVVNTGSQLYGAWTDKGAFLSVVMAKLDATGAQSAPITLGGATADAQFPSFGTGTAGTAIVWSDARDGHLDVRMRKLDAATDTVLRTGVAGDASQPRVLALDNGFVSAWEDTRSGSEEVYLAWTDAAGAKKGELLVEQAGGSANWPRLARTKNGVAVVYYQFRDGEPQIFVTALDGAYAHVGGDLQISKTPSGAKARFADVASSGTDLGVVWVDTRSGAPQAYFARIACP